MNKGYWTYEDMIIQVEDCIDCLKTIYGNTYQYLFLFDHSNGHNRIAPDALSPTTTRKTYRGKQPAMRDSTILNEKESFLGLYSHPNKLKVGDVQKMTFSISDNGPFYLNQTQHHNKQFDTIKGNRIADTKAKEEGNKESKGKQEKAQRIMQKNISITYQILDIESSWVNKPKGALQILYERGWIDPDIKPTEYTWKQKLNKFKIWDTSKSIQRMISSQPNFQNQKPYSNTTVKNMESKPTDHLWHTVK